LTDPHIDFLDREKLQNEVNQHFGKTVWLLRDLVNYGTNLIPRCYESSRKDFADPIILAVLTKHVVVLLDSFELNIAHGAVLASQLPARGLYEATLYVSWILEDDTDRRARKYYVWQLRQERRHALCLIPGTNENTRFIAACENTPYLQGFATSASAKSPIDDAKKTVQQIDRFLSSSGHIVVNQEFDYTKKHRDKPWYYEPQRGEEREIGSLGVIAERLHRRAEYESFYSKFSDVTHSSVFRNHLRIEGGTATFEPIRHLEGIDWICRIVCATIFRFYREILEKYRPGEVENFNRKYVS